MATYYVKFYWDFERRGKEHNILSRFIIKTTNTDTRIFTNLLVIIVYH